MKLRKSEKPIWTCDAETDPFEFGVVPKPFIWGIYTGEDYHEFIGTGENRYCTRDDLKKMVDFLREQEVIIYAHNGGKFDWHFLTEYLEPDQEILVINGRLARFEIGKCEFRDSWNLIPVPLGAYGKDEIEYEKMHYLFREEHLQEIRDYLKSDCVYLHEMIKEFENEYGIHITQAQAAMHLWKYQFKNKVPRSGPIFYDEFRPWYFGGRVQCFQFGDSKHSRVPSRTLSIDINSAYPYAMLSPHPYSLEYKKVRGKPKHVYENWGPIFFTVSCIARGCFPYRATTGALYYPADDIERVYYVTGYELQAAIETETIDNLTIIEHFVFEETKDFSEYVNYFYEKRLTAETIGESIFAKLFLNSLYGKFATDPRKYKTHILKPASQLQDVLQELGEHDTFKHFKEWILVCQNRDDPGKNPFFNVTTGASITGFVRAYLWRAICNAENVVYCDTDSITAEAFPGVEFSRELGQWDLENYYDRVIVCGKKMYAMHVDKKKTEKATGKKIKKQWKIASKGAALDHNDMQKMAAGTLVMYDNIAPTFSTSKSEPSFVSRELRMTATDITQVPPDIDPLFADSDPEP